MIVAVGSTPVAGFRDLDRAIAAHRAGQSVDLHIVRHGNARVVHVQLLAAPRALRRLRLDAPDNLLV